MHMRIEHDTMGEIEVPNEALWGAQTQRSLQNFLCTRQISQNPYPIRLLLS